MKTCKKCHTEVLCYGTCWVDENSEFINLCKLCTSALQEIEMDLRKEFIKDEDTSMIKNHITKNMIDARLNRYHGQSLWNSEVTE